MTIDANNYDLQDPAFAAQVREGFGTLANSRTCGGRFYSVLRDIFFHDYNFKNDQASEDVKGLKRIRSFQERVADWADEYPSYYRVAHKARSVNNQEERNTLSGDVAVAEHLRKSLKTNGFEPDLRGYEKAMLKRHYFSEQQEAAINTIESNRFNRRGLLGGAAVTGTTGLLARFAWPMYKTPSKPEISSEQFHEDNINNNWDENSQARRETAKRLPPEQAAEGRKEYLDGEAKAYDSMTEQKIMRHATDKLPWKDEWTNYVTKAEKAGSEGKMMAATGAALFVGMASAAYGLYGELPGDKELYKKGQKDLREDIIQIAERFAWGYEPILNNLARASQRGQSSPGA